MCLPFLVWTFQNAASGRGWQDARADGAVDAATSGSFTIAFEGDITEGTDSGSNISFGNKNLSAPPDLYALNLANGVTVTIDGAKNTLDGAGQYQGFFVYQGNVTIESLTIADAAALGGNGGAGTIGGGGFGGGGGGGFSTNSIDTSGDNGGFGGGAGAGGFGGGGAGGAQSGGLGGFGAGRGNNSGSNPNLGGGGRGPAAGGDVFIEQGATVVIEGGTLGLGSLSGGLGGTAGGGANDGGNGSAFGNGIFLQGNQTETLAAAAGQTLTIDGVIADQSGSGATGANTGVGGLVISGPGTVALNLANTFTGGINLEEGTLLLGAGDAAGAGAISFNGEATLAFSIANAPGNAIENFADGDRIDLTNLAFTGSRSAMLVDLTVIVTEGGKTVDLSITLADQTESLFLLPDGSSGTDLLAVNTGDVTTVSSGVTSTGLTIGNGALLQVLSGGSAIDAQVAAGGISLVSSGGFVSGNQLSGGSELVFGVTSAVEVHSGGVEVVASGGTANGTVVDGNGSLLVLSGGTAIDTVIGGTLDLAEGSQVVGGILFATGGATLAIGGTETPDAQSTAFTDGDAIDLNDIPFDSGGSAILNPTTDVLTVTEGGESFALQMDGNFSDAVFGLADDPSGNGTEITVSNTPCFASGTRILTDRGEIAVEHLAIGDRVVTFDGEMLPIQWIGHRRVACLRHHTPESVLPVRIRADSFAPGQPKRDLFLSPDHAVFAEGVLIPVKYLAVGTAVGPDPGQRGDLFSC